MVDKEQKARCLEKYLGKIGEDDILEMATEWYSAIITNQYNCDNVVFVTDRSYMLASAIETVSGRLMESESSIKIFTASSFCSYYEQLVQFYVEHHQFPMTLLCEDLVSYGNISTMLDFMYKNILRSLKNTFSNDVKEEVIKSRFLNSMCIHIIASPRNENICFGLSDDIVPWFSIYRVATKKYDRCKANDLSNRLSNCVKFMNSSSDTYNCYEVISKEKNPLSNHNDFMKTVYQNKLESTYIEPICIGNQLKAIFSIRIVQNDASEDNLCVIPFAFLPNLSRNETEDIWESIKAEIAKNESAICQEFIIHMDQLKELDGKILFNEYLTLIFNYALLDDFNQENGIDFTHIDLYQQQLETLARNYNITDTDKTKEYLNAIFQNKYLKKEKLCQLLQSKMHEEKRICCVNECSSDLTLSSLEDYWYNLAVNRVRECRLTKNRFSWFREQCTKVNGLCFSIDNMLNNQSIDNIKKGITNLLQLIDANIVDISFLSLYNMDTTGYAQFSKPGAMASFIYPNMLKEYIPTLMEMRQKFYHILYTDYDAKKGNKDWWVAFATNFFEIYSSYADPLTANKIEYFLKNLKVAFEKPDDWNIEWDKNIDYFIEGMVGNKYTAIGASLEYKVTRNRCLREFGTFYDDVVLSCDRQELKKKMKIY